MILNKEKYSEIIQIIVSTNIRVFVMWLMSLHNWNMRFIF